jgi:lipocalin-like protein
MKNFQRSMLAAVGGLLFLASSGVTSSAQQSAPDRLSGSWQLKQDNAKGDGLGPNAEGILIFSGGNFAVQIVNAQLSRFKSDDRSEATPAEGEAGVKASLAYFGTFEQSDASHLTLHIARASFPNWSRADQEWNVTLNADVLTLTSPKDSKRSLIWTRIGPALFTTRGGRRVVGY